MKNDPIYLIKLNPIWTVKVKWVVTESPLLTYRIESDISHGFSFHPTVPSPTLDPIDKGTRFTKTGGMKDWVDHNYGIMAGACWILRFLRNNFRFRVSRWSHCMMTRTAIEPIASLSGKNCTVGTEESCLGRKSSQSTIGWIESIVGID